MSSFQLFTSLIIFSWWLKSLLHWAPPCLKLSLAMLYSYAHSLPIILSCDPCLSFPVDKCLHRLLSSMYSPAKRLETHPEDQLWLLEGPHPASPRARCNHSQSSEVYDLFLVVPNVRSRCPSVELAALLTYLNIFQFCSLRPLLPCCCHWCGNMNVVKSWGSCQICP